MKRIVQYCCFSLLFGAFFAPLSVLSEEIAANNEHVLKLPPAREELLRQEYKPGFAGSFLSGNFARNQQDMDKASYYLEQSLKSSPKSERFVLDTIRAHVLAGNIRKAEELAKALPEAAKAEPMPALLLAISHFETRQYDEALTFLARTKDSGLIGIVKPAMIAWIKLAQNPHEDAIAGMDEAVMKSGFFAPFLHYQQALMYELAGNYKKARSHMEKAVGNPETAPYRVVDMLARLYIRIGAVEQVKQLIAQFNEANSEAVFTLDYNDVLKGKTGAEIANANYGMAELFFTTASILFGEDISIETLAYLRLALHLRPNFAPAQFMLAHMYEQQKSYERALTIYNSIRPGNIFFERGQLRKALNLDALGRFDEAISALDKISKTKPDDIAALITKADLLREKKRYVLAADIYSQALARVGNAKPAHWSIYYARGICYERTGDWKHAESDFLMALQLEPEQPDVLNYLAYSWLVMGKNISKAREYLQIAVDARPEDAHIVDSMGWAHYIAGDFKQAIEYLERAVELSPTDAAINDHLGDAYWRYGRALEARYQWRRALRNKPDMPLKKEIRAKIENGLPPFLHQQNLGVTQEGIRPESQYIRRARSKPAQPVSVE